MQNILRVVTKARWLTSDDNTRLYEEKLEHTRKDNEAKEKRKVETEKRKLQKNLECKKGGARTRSGTTRMTNQRTQRHSIKTRGGKHGSFFRPADQETKEQHKQFELDNTPNEEY